MPSATTRRRDPMCRRFIPSRSRVGCTGMADGLAARLFLWAGVVGAMAAAPVSSAQQPAFEVVSIKRSAPDAPPGTAGPYPGGRYILRNGPARVLINVAFSEAQTREIVGAPDWVARENYDVVASAGRDATYQELQAMMRTMLADRFKLVARYEKRERPVYHLVVARPDRTLGPRLKRRTRACEPSRDPCDWKGARGSFNATGYTMEGLAYNLAGPVGRVVFDKTGLEGEWEFAVEYADSPLSNDAAGSTGPSLFTALEEQLGLKLVPAQEPISLVVIDRIERPTPD